MSRLRASEERQFCPWKNVALQITRISNPMQGMNFQYNTNALPEDFSNAFPGSEFPSTTILTPPSTGRGKKGKSRSKKTVPKPVKPDDQETFSFHTPPESPEDCMEVVCHHGSSEMLSDGDDDLEEFEQDYRYMYHQMERKHIYMYIIPLFTCCTKIMI